MKRYNPFAALGMLSSASPTPATGQSLGIHPNSFFAEEQAHEILAVIPLLVQISTQAEHSTNHRLCYQLDELMAALEMEEGNASRLGCR